MMRILKLIFNRKLKSHGGLVTILFCLLVTITSGPVASGQDDGRKVFETKCFSCHSIGGGDKQGPDLKGLSDRRSQEWIKSFTKSPATFSRSDPAAAELLKRFSPEIMPDQTLSNEELDAIIDLIQKLTASNEIFTPEGAKLSREIRTGDIENGWRYFTGQKRFQNGGVSCNSCHSLRGLGALGGGTLGPDLTAVNIKYRDPELILILQNPNFPTMAEMFRDRNLTDEEIVQVFAYLQHSKTENPHAQVVATTAAGTAEPGFLAIGFVITILALVGLNFVWRKRHSGVREDIVRRSKI